MSNNSILALSFKCSNATDKFGGCIYGYCDESGTKCICEEGYMHEFIFLRQRNCGLPVNALPIGSSIIIFLCLICIFVSIYQAYHLSKKLRTIAIISSIQTASFIIVHIIFVVDKYMRPASWVFIFIWGVSMEVMNVMLLQTVAEPIYLLLGKSVKDARKSINLFGLYTFICILPLLVTAAFATSYPNGSYGKEVKGEIEYTIMVFIDAGCISIALVPAIIVLSLTIIKLEGEILKLIKFSETHNQIGLNTATTSNDSKKNNDQLVNVPEPHASKIDPLKIHLIRLRYLKIGIILFITFSGITVIGICLVYLRFGSAPYLWLSLYAGFAPAHFLVAMMPLAYARKYHLQSSGKKESSNEPAGGNSSNQAVGFLSRLFGKSNKTPVQLEQNPIPRSVQVSDSHSLNQAA